LQKGVWKRQNKTGKNKGCRTVRSTGVNRREPARTGAKMQGKANSLAEKEKVSPGAWT
jgi:hypothetical protein